MREILFRGKRVDNGEWITGQLLRYEDGRARIIESKTDCFCYEKDESIIQTVAYSASPETAGQYTGLTDKNGTKIFEDDVCYIADGQLDEADGVFIVEWDEDLAGFILNGCYIVDFDNVYGHQIEVIGNIHDNPELLTEATP